MTYRLEGTHGRLSSPPTCSHVPASDRHLPESGAEERGDISRNAKAVGRKSLDCVLNSGPDELQAGVLEEHLNLPQRRPIILRKSCTLVPPGPTLICCEHPRENGVLARSCLCPPLGPEIPAVLRAEWPIMQYCG